jgi:hypothetical protein
MFCLETCAKRNDAMMKCDVCKRELSADAPVWRVQAGQGMIDRNKSTGSVCRECCESKGWLDNCWWMKWEAPRPCDQCDRQLHWSDRRKVRKHFICGPECALRAYYPKRRTAARACAACGKSFVPRRADTRFCSAACRQRAYRIRLTRAPSP